MVGIDYVNPPRFGEIWMCRLEGRGGSVQSGYRPAFILSNDLNNTHSTTINVIPLTSKMGKRRLPVHVELWDYKEYGLNTPSTMLIEQITTVPVNTLDFRVGKISDSETIEKIRKAILVQFPVFSMVS